MKRKLLSLVVIVALCVTMLPTAGWASENTGAIDEWQVPEAPTTDGSWTDEEKYDISWYTGAAAGTTNFELEDAADLAGLAAIVNGTATSNGKSVLDSFESKTVTLKEDTDFDLSAHAWIPIRGFKGTFDGNKDSDTAIKKMVVNLQEESGGLFSYGMAGTIENVSVKEAYIQTTSDAGGIVARSTAGSTIENCSFDGDIVANGEAGPSATTAGGIVGENVGTVQNCTVSGSISGTSGNMGGIVGFNGSISSGSKATVINCKNNAQIAGYGSTGYSHDGAGGIAGQSFGTVKDCTNNGTITSQGPNIGGIVGLMYVADDQAVVESCTVESCTNAGIVNAHADYLGGIVGAVYVASQNVDECKIQGCSNTEAITAQADVNGLTSTTGGVLGGVLDYKDTKITIQQCKNMGAVSAGYSFNNSYGVGGIVGDVGNVGNVASLSVKETFNSGTVTATDMSSNYGEHHSKNIGVGGLIGRASDEEAIVEIENAYNVGNVSSGEMTLQVGGIVGIWHNDTHKKISAVYNAGLLKGNGSKGSIIGNGENAALTNVSYWSGCGGSGVGNSRTANQMTGENWATELGLSTDMWSKSENAEDGTGYLPVLKNNQQNPAPTLTRTAKQDQAALSISAEKGVFTDDSNRVIRENHAPFTLTASGGTTDQAIYWTISQDDDIVTIDQNGLVTLTKKAFGNVIITATMPGDDTYNDVSTSFTFSVKPLDIAEATIYDLHAPVAGVSPVMSARVPEDAHYEGMVAADFGSGMTGVQWKDAEGKFLTDRDAFEQGAQYTAIIRLQSDDLYDWEENVKISIDGIQPAAIEQVSSIVDEDNLIITVVFKPTNHEHEWSSDWSSDGLYHWYACLNDDCTETASGSNGYEKHTDANNDGICDTCGATIGYVITFDANGGSCDTTSVRTDLDGKIIALPEASRDGYTFRGWFTAASGGEQVTLDKVYSADTTLYAQWEKIPEPPYTGKYSYEIFTDDSEHGALDVDRYATEGEKVTITVLPDDGYALDEIVITDKHGEAIDFVDNGDGTITFIMPSGDVTITATFAEADEPECALPFVDVHANDWFFDPVCYVYREGLMTGTSATTFAPNATTTRAMIVSILARQENVTSAEDAGFTDVAAGDWFATAVNWAAREGIVAGFEDDSFRPNEAITREQLAAILCNYSAWKGEDTSARADLSRYSDAAEISSWATDVMRWAVAEGLISGMTADELQPQGSATRAQVAAILQRYLEK